MNIVFMSPHFPAHYFRFCQQLNNVGATVLGLGDAAYEALEPEVRSALAEYYRVEDMHDYDALLRACGYFTHKYGKLNRFESLNEYWNAGVSFPASCETCIGEDGNLTDYHKYQLAEDSNLRVGFLSTKQDAVVTVDQGTMSGPEFERQLLEAIDELSEDFPERFQSLIANGDGHTFIIRDFERSVGGTTVKQWVADMLNSNADWTSVSD